jgi:hypothetical protein
MSRTSCGEQVYNAVHFWLRLAYHINLLCKMFALLNQIFFW